MPRRNRLKAIGIGAAGAALLVVSFAAGARAATVDHFSIGAASVTEGDAGTVNMTFTISYVGALNNISVDWATANGTAVAGSDYVAASGTATFLAAGPRTQTINILVNGDLLNEANETFTVTLSNPLPAATADITTAVGTGTITDNDPLPSIVINDVSVAEGNVGTTNADFTVTLSAPSGRNVTVNYATANSTAVQPGDYTTTSGTLTFLPGQVTKTVSVPVVGDVLDEIDETFFVNLTVPTNSTIADNQGIGTILDDDPAPSLSINDVALVEGNAGTSNMTFTVTLSAASGKTITVDYATADGTATSPADYTVSAATLSFAPGVLTRTFTVPIVGDTLNEFNETFVVNLTNPTNATISDNQGIGTITDNDPIPTLAFANVTVIEGDAGAANATFTVTLSAASGKTVTVDYATADGTATSPADYTPTSGTLTFTPGQTSKTIDVPIVGDLLNEASETYTLTLSNPVNATVPTATRTGTITDNDPLPSIVINDVSVAEGNVGTTNADFTVTLSAPSGRNVTVNYATANSTAVQPGDYTTTSGTLTFLPGQVTKTVSVPVVGDVLDEIDETFFVNLTVPTNSTIADNQGIGTILDDDPAPSLSINDVALVEGNAGTSNMTFTVTLSAASGKTITVDYATADGTATSPADYTVSAATLSFAPGVLTRTFTVPIVGDTLNEFNETFVVNLTNPTNATISDNQGIGTITDNDPIPTLAFANVTVIEGDAGAANATFTVTLSAASGKTVTVDYATADGTATSPADYTPTSGTLTFTPGQTSKTIDVPIVGDLLNEASETYTLTLSNPVNATVPTATRTGTITDNDPLPSIVINDVSVAEGNVGTTNATFTLTLSAPSGRAVTVRATSANGTATQPADYTSTNLIVTFPAGTTTQTFSVPVVGDVLDEADDTFFVNLTAPTNSTIADNQGIGTILDDDPLPAISINDAALIEGNVGTTNLTFTVTLSPVSGRTVTVDYSTADLTAVAPGDYTASAGTVTFNAGTVTRTISVPIVGDVTDEFDETFAVNLTNPGNATISDNQGIGTILNDEVPPTVSVDNVTVAEGDVGTTTATFTVSLSAASGKPIAVDYATADATAVAPGDYAAASGTLNFVAGQTTKTVDVTVKGDTLDEFDETFTLGLSNLVNVTAGTVTGTGTITDDDAAPSVSVNNVTVAEGDVGTTTATFTVSLSAASGKPIAVDYATADATAVAPGDYAAASGTLNLAPGETSKTVDVTVKGDTIYEGDETFSLGLSNLVNVSPGTLTGTGTITDDDPLPQISIDDQTATEGNAGTTTFTFTVSLTNPSAFPISVDYATADATASSPSDYASTSGTLTFAPGELSKPVAVDVVGDVTDEFDETFAVNLTNASGAGMADGHGVGTIVNDDVPPTVSVDNVTVAEGDVGTTTATFTVSLSAASGKPIAVDYATADATAVAPGDYAAASGTLNFVAGQTTKTVDVTVKGDTLDEFDETFTLGLSNLVNVTAGTVTGTGTITDDDAAPSVSVNNVTVAEGDVGTTTATFTVSLSAASGKPIAVDYATADATAVAPGDYAAASGTLNLAPGETSKTVDVTVKGDTIYEGDETFSLGLSNLVNVSPGTLTGTGTITDDDPLPQISIDDQTATEGNAGTTTFTFTVSLTNPSAFPISVDYATADATASSPSDYASTSGTLTFAPGELSKPVAVDVVGDVTDEFDETFAVNLTNASGAGMADGHGVGTIVNDDGLPVLDIGDATVTEGNAGDVIASFPVTLTGATQLPVTVDVTTADGTATAGSDYAATSATLTFAPGDLSQTFEVPVHGDTALEGDETFSAIMSNPSDATIGVGSAQGTILNDDAAPGLVISDVSQPEGNSGDSLATFIVSIGSPSGFPITVDVASQDGTATQPSDYDAVATTITFPPGDTTEPVAVTIHGDTLPEPNETYTVQLSNAVGASISDAVGVGTIVDDDTVVPPPPPPPPAPVVSIGDSSVQEGDSGTTTNLSFPVSLSRALTSGVTIDYETADGTATAGSDYIGTTGSLVIPAGGTTGSVHVTVIGDDRVEPNETLALQITGVTGARRGSNGTGTIVNDDRYPTRLTLHVRVHGGRGRTTDHRIDVRGRLINGAPHLPIRVVLMRRRGDAWVVVAHVTAWTRHRRHAMHEGTVAFAYRSTFHMTQGGRYRVRAVFLGDALRRPTRAHVRFRI